MAPLRDATLADRVRAGEVRALAKAITLVESTRPADRSAALGLLEALPAPASGTLRIGISGSPGVGKSTFIEAFGLRAVEAGHRIAVLTIDPSSRLAGGSILGDKTRMAELSQRPEAFIRPTPAGRTLGGVARRTREAIVLCEAAGFDVVVVETVGVGQSETAVAGMTDLFLLLLAPLAGDELQGIKRGVMELADLVLVNKADGAQADAAGRTVAEYRNALHLMRPRTPRGPRPSRRAPPSPGMASRRRGGAPSSAAPPSRRPATSRPGAPPRPRSGSARRSRRRCTNGCARTRF